MKNYQVSLRKLVAFMSALMLLSVGSPIACFAADDDNLPGLNVLRAPQPEPPAVVPLRTADDGLLRKTPKLMPPPETPARTDITDKSSSSKAYTLGPGDVLSVTDYGLRGDSDFPSQTVTVLPDGTVNIYPVGLMKVVGLTVKEFNNRLNDKAKEYVIEPQYVVTIVQARPISVYVLGEVQNPGLYSFGESGGVSDSDFGPMGSFPGSSRLRANQSSAKGKLSKNEQTTLGMLGAVYGAKFAQWAPKWGSVGTLAVMGMKKSGGDGGDGSPSGLPQVANPVVAPGAGMPARSLPTMSSGYGSFSGNLGSLAVGDAAGGVNPVMPGFGGGGGIPGFGGGGGGYSSGTFSGGGYPGGGYSGGSNMLIPGGAAVNVSNVTVMNAIERAGGLRETANVRRIQVRRAEGNQVINVDIWKLVNEGDITQDVVMQPGDTVFIPQGGSDFNPDALGTLASFKGRWVRVLGSVRAPGLVELRPNDDIYSVVARAGGFQPGAATRSVVLSRMNRDGTVFAKRISLARGLKDREALARLPVQSGDVVLVSTSLIKTAGTEVLRAGMITGLAMLIIYFSNKVHNVNVVTDDEGAPTNNARVAVF